MLVESQTTTAPFRRTTDDARTRRSIAEHLVIRCADGDQQALAELYALYSGFLLRRVQTIVRSLERAEDVLQEVFLYVWRNAKHYNRQRSAVSTWLWQIARSRAIDKLRRVGSRDRANARLSKSEATNPESQAERKVLRGELRHQLDKALDKLPAAQKQAVHLAYFADMTQAEIAAHSSTPLGTVKSRTSLAMRKLRSELTLTQHPQRKGRSHHVS